MSHSTPTPPSHKNILSHKLSRVRAPGRDSSPGFRKLVERLEVAMWGLTFQAW